MRESEESFLLAERHPTIGQMQPQTSLWRRLIQFNLRTLLLSVLLIAIALTVWREQKPATGLPIDWNQGKLPRAGGQDRHAGLDVHPARGQ